MHRLDLPVIFDLSHEVVRVRSAVGRSDEPIGRLQFKGRMIVGQEREGVLFELHSAFVDK